MKTREEILAEIEIHRKSGALSRVALLEERLNPKPICPAAEGPPPKINEDDSQTGGQAPPGIAQEVAEGPASGASFRGHFVNPMDKIAHDNQEAKEEAYCELMLTLGEMKAEGMSWTDIVSSTGVSSPWSKVAAWKRKQEKIKKAK